MTGKLLGGDEVVAQPITLKTSIPSSSHVSPITLSPGHLCGCGDGLAALLDPAGLGIGFDLCLVPFGTNNSFAMAIGGEVGKSERCHQREADEESRG